MNPEAIDFVSKLFHDNENYLQSLLYNPAAKDIILEKRLPFSSLANYAEFPHIFPALDLEKCIQVLKGEEVSHLFVEKLIRNVGARPLIAKYIHSIIRHYPREACEIANIYDLAIKHIDKLAALGTMFLTKLNKNELAAEFLIQHPKYLMWPYFAQNPAGIDHTIKEVERRLEENKYIPDEMINNLNRNPNAVDWLRKHPQFINDHLMANPNIFEYTTEGQTWNENEVHEKIITSIKRYNSRA